LHFFIRISHSLALHDAFCLFFPQRGIPKFIETLNFRKLKVGMQVLGAVREINELDLVVSLPNGLAGYVSLAEGACIKAAPPFSALALNSCPTSRAT
jgi:hypothetical protein